MNKVMLFGRLGADPERRHTNSGTAVTSLSVATDYRHKDKWSGEMVSKTEWHRVTCWARTAEVAHEYLRKGSQVLIEGRLETRKWQDKEGKDRYTTEIQCEQLTLVGKARDGESRPAAQGQENYKSSASEPQDFDDDIPFAWFLAPMGTFLVEYMDGASQVLSLV